MRSELQKMNEVRSVFQATFERFGTKRAFRGADLTTVLLRDVRDMQGDPVADHIWMNYTKEFASLELKAGDKVQFHARVKQYIKGYKGWREDVYDKPVQSDYKLSHPTKVCIILQ